MSSSTSDLTKGRHWWLSPYDLGPRCHIPALYDSEGYDGVAPNQMHVLRGPFATAAEAAKAGRAWREQGRRSKFWMVLVVDRRVKHCRVFRDEHEGKNAL